MLDRSKHYSEILEGAVKEGTREINRSTGSLFLSAVSAGLDLGFGILLIAVFITIAGDTINTVFHNIGIGVLYSIGFVLVVVGRSALFTEHTTLAILPVLDRKAGVIELIRVWVTILCGNLLGAAVFSFLAYNVGLSLGLIGESFFIFVRHDVLSYSYMTMFGSAVLAGWLMGLLTWLIQASKETVGDVLIVVLVTFAISFLGLHHSIAGSIEVLLTLFGSHLVNLSDFLLFLFWVVAGNIVGGVVFVGILKYSHVKKA